MSQSSRRHATAEARKLWRLAGDIACLLMHGDLHRPQAFAQSEGFVVSATIEGWEREHAKRTNPAPHDYSAHVRTHFERLRALIFLGEPFDGERLEIAIEETQWRRELPRLVEIRLALQEHPPRQLTQPEPSPQLRRKLREARPALSDASRRDRPAYWVANAFTSRAAAVLGADHPRVQRHEEAVRTAVLTSLHTVDGPNPRTRTRARPGPNRDGYNVFHRHGHGTYDGLGMSMTYRGASVTASPAPWSLDTSGDLTPATFDPSLLAVIIDGYTEELARQTGIPARFLSGQSPQYSQELTRALLTVRGGVGAPGIFLAAHPGVDSFEITQDRALYELAVTYRGTADPRELEEQLGEIVLAHVAVHARKLPAVAPELSPAVVAAAFPPAD